MGLINYRNLRQFFENKTNSMVEIIIRKDSTVVHCQRRCKVPFTENNTVGVNYEFTIALDKEHEYTPDMLSGRATFGRNQLGRLVDDHERGVGGVNCCGDAFHSRGFRHHPKCVNWVQVF